MRTALLVLATLTVGFPSFAASQLRPELPLGAPPREAAASSSVSVAASPRELFAVWNDSTTGESYGTAIGADGVTQNPRGVRISSMRVSEHDAVAWTGDSYVIAVLSCLRFPCTGSTMLVGADGTVRREPVPFGPADVAIVKANGSRVLLISDADNQRNLITRNGIFFLSSDGTTTLLKAFSQTVGQCVAFATNDGFVVYAFENGLDKPTAALKRLAIENSGVVTERVLGNFPLATRIAVASNGRDELLVWTLPVSVGTMNGIDGAVHLTTACELLDSSGNVKGAVATISDSIVKWYTDINLPPTVAAPSVAWDGSRFVVAYVDYDGTQSSLKVTAVSPGGRPVDEAPAIADRTGYEPNWSGMVATLTPFQGRQFLFWSCRRGHSYSPSLVATYFRGFDSLASFAAGPAVELAGSLSMQSQPALSTDGRAVAVAWCESPLQGRVMAQVISSAGLSEPVTLSDKSASSSRPGVASGGGIHVVAWTERDAEDPARFRIMARRLGTDGRLLDHEPIVLEAGKYDDRVNHAALFRTPVAWDGSNFLISWTGSQGRAFMSRLSPQGERLGPVQLAPGTSYQYDVQLIPIGERVLAVYQSRITPGWWELADLNGVWIHDGLPGPQLTFMSIPNEANSNGVMASWNGRRLALAWREPANDVFTVTVMGRSFPPDGYPLVPPRRLLEPAAAYLLPSSGGSLIADASSGWWYVARSDAQPTFAQKLDDDLNADGSRIEVAPGGRAVLDGVGVGVGGNIAIVYSRLDDSAPEEPSQRLFLQWLLLQPRGRAVRK